MSDKGNQVWGRGIKMGIGAWSWGDRLFWDYGKSHDLDDVREAFQTSLKGGVRLFDTAELYGWGKAEKVLGRQLESSSQPVQIVTKFLPLPWRLTRGSLVRALRGSLERLGQEQVDLYLVHQPWPPVPVETWAEALADAVEAGLARHVGVSNYGPDKMRRAHQVLARRGVALAANQVEYHLLHRDPERNGLLAEAERLGVRVMAWGPLGQGLLTGKYSPENPLPGVRGLAYNRRLKEVQPLLRTMREIGEAHDKTPAQLAISWVIAKGPMPIPGAKNGQQAAENAEAGRWQLPADAVAALDEASEHLA
ncbi:MAG: aldo/keto reductase [Anaerolineae bacterium]|nr:aldo/keto reductase [Anaerolineae bacterium]